MVKPGEIYFVKNAKLGSCLDGRPCVVLAVRGETSLVYYLSSQFDSSADAEITLLKTDPDFAASGLKKDSYIPAIDEVRKPTAEFEKAKLLGHATGEFKKKIEALYGAPLE